MGFLFYLILCIADGVFDDDNDQEENDYETYE